MPPPKAITAKGAWYPQLDGLNLPGPLTNAMQQVYSLVYSLRDSIPRPPAQSLIVAQADLAMQSANLAPTVLYAVPVNSGGMYRVNFYVVVTRAATTSASIPYGVIGFTDGDLNLSASVGPIGNPSNTANTAGAGNNSGGYADVASFNVKGGLNITYSTANYASTGTTPMQYAAHLRLEYLG